jgi:hypothetical protein
VDSETATATPAAAERRMAAKAVELKEEEEEREEDWREEVERVVRAREAETAGRMTRGLSRA